MSCDNTGKKCACTYPCENHGKCCDCIAYHRNRGEAPACLFSEKAEKTYDRSLENLFKDKLGK